MQERRVPPHQQFVRELQEMRLSFAEFSRLTDIPLRTVYSYASGERRIPAWMPFILKCVRKHRGDSNGLPV